MFIFKKVVEIGEVNLYNFEELYVLVKRVDNTSLLVINLKTEEELKSFLKKYDDNYILFNKNQITDNNTEI